MFDFKRFSDHEGMLRRVMRKQPTAEQLTQGLRDVDAPLVGVLTTRDEVGRVVAARGGRKAAEIHEKAARYAETRVYESADMLYFVYFDAAGVMRDFTCVSR